MTAPQALRDLALKIDDVTLVAPRMGCVLYFDRAAPEVLRDVADKAMAALDGYLTHYMTDTAARGAQRSAKSSEIFAHFFDRPRPNANYWMQFQGCHIKQGISDAELTLSYNPHPDLPENSDDIAAAIAKNFVSYEEKGAIFMPKIQIIKMAFPLDHPLAQPDALLAWVRDLDCIQNPSFVSGHAGYQIERHDTVDLRSMMHEMNSVVASALSRHPGLDFENTGWVSAFLLKYWPDHVWFLPRIKRVNWLTFVRNQMLDELCGGTDQVVQSLNGYDGIICHDLGDGKIIQAGAAPAIGDVTTGDILPAYRRVAKALAPARLPKVKAFGKVFSNDIANAWLNALERDDD